MSRWTATVSGNTVAFNFEVTDPKTGKVIIWQDMPCESGDERLLNSLRRVIEEHPGGVMAPDLGLVIMAHNWIARVRRVQRIVRTGKDDK